MLLMLLSLIVGIPLTIVAWMRGWKGWALIPIPSGFVASYIAAVFMVGIAASEDEYYVMVFFSTILVCLAYFGALIAMTIKKREPKMIATSQPPMGPAVNQVGDYRPTRYCMNCGQQLGDSARFCRNCGQMVRPASEGGLMANNQTPQPVR